MNRFARAGQGHANARLITALLGAVLLLAACAGSGAGTSIKTGGTLTIDNESGGLWTCGFNPYNGAVQFLSFGAMYESLVYENVLTDKKTPMLATSWSWNQDNSVLTATIRKGVKWSDGRPFGASDVVFTFNLLKKFTALDLTAAWSVLSSVSQVGSDQVAFTFSQPAVPFFYFIAADVSIVPEHIWSSIKDPTTFDDPNPVVTGPFTIGECTPQNITYARNPRYWQSGLPHLAKVNYPAFTSNDSANSYLATGKAQWGGQFIPNIETYYIAKDRGHNHYWFPPTSNIDLFLNLKKPPLDNKLVRQALAFAINRSRVSKIGEYGYEPAGNQTGIVTPTFSSWIDNGQASRYGYKYDAQKAISLLQQAGYTRGSDGIMRDASGKALKLSVVNNGGYSDWVAAVQVIVGNLKDIGIELTPQNLSYDDWTNKLFNGDFQLGYDAATGGPSPYYEFRNVLLSDNSAPLGQPAASNFERWEDPATDSLLKQFGATTSLSEQQHILSQLEGVMLEDVPIIPVNESVSWYQYSTKKFAGWPTQSDPYAAPAPWNLPDWGIVLTHVYEK